MKEKNVIDLKFYSNRSANNCNRNFLRKITHSMKEPALIGSLNGFISGAIGAILATYGYIALPGFGPVITMGVGVAFAAGSIMGAIIGFTIGILVGIFFIFMKN
ncbi:Mg/Co/Ni transporter MgtE [Bartonella silvatica]|uniref:Mg/Co/Ni transporter MgtE n=1 Tax=Bartonella silvatica TaxID=357760 RepID=A0ABV2HIB9_9HYPH